MTRTPMMREASLLTSHCWRPCGAQTVPSSGICAACSADHATVAVAAVVQAVRGLIAAAVALEVLRAERLQEAAWPA